jgi:hypothetical protein
MAPSLCPKDAPSVTYEYRVFLIHDGVERTFVHESPERLREGVVMRVAKPGSQMDGESVTIYAVLAHPTDGRPGIAYGRDVPPPE